MEVFLDVLLGAHQAVFNAPDQLVEVLSALALVLEDLLAVVLCFTVNGQLVENVILVIYDLLLLCFLVFCNNFHVLFARRRFLFCFLNRSRLSCFTLLLLYFGLPFCVSFLFRRFLDLLLSCCGSGGLLRLFLLFLTLEFLHLLLKLFKPGCCVVGSDGEVCVCCCGANNGKCSNHFKL